MAWYRAGTVALTNGSTTVTGTGTAFNSNVSIGEGFNAPDGRQYEIANVVSDTVLTLATSYLGSTASGQGYSIAPLRGLDRTNATLLAELINSFGVVRDGIGAGLFPDGTDSLPAGRFASDQDTGFARVAGSNTFSIITGGIEALRSTPTMLFVGGAGLGGNTGALELGTLRNADGSFLIDLTTQGPGGDFTARILRAGGANGTFDLINSGTGDFRFIQNGNASFTWSSNGVFRMVLTSGGLFPGPDNATALGLGSNRWSVVFAGTGTINTSDEREKHWRGSPDEAALRAANRIIGELGFFQWEDSVAEKGEDGARIHFGARAQDVMRIMAEEGLEDEQLLDFGTDTFLAAADRPSFRHAFLCFDTWDDEFQPEMEDVEVPIEEPTGLVGENGAPLMRVRTRKEPRPTGKMTQTRHAGNRFGLRIDQLTMFLLAALASRVAALEAGK